MYLQHSLLVPPLLDWQVSLLQASAMANLVRRGWAGWLTQTTAPLLQACKLCKLHFTTS